MLSMAGVSSAGTASLGCERVGAVTGLSPITGVNPSVAQTEVCSWGSRTNSGPSVEGINRGRNCS